MVALIITCRSRTSLKLQQNEIKFVARCKFMLGNFFSSFLSFAGLD